MLNYQRVYIGIGRMDQIANRIIAIDKAVIELKE